MNKNIFLLRIIVVVFISFSLLAIVLSGAFDRASQVIHPRTKITQKLEAPPPQVVNAIPSLLEEMKGKKTAYKGSQFAIPLIFEQNVGQTDKEVDYLLRQQNYIMYFTGNKFVSAIGGQSINKAGYKPRPVKPNLLTMSLINAKDRKAKGIDRIKTKINQYVGADEKRWLTDIPGFSQLQYKNVYKGIDMVWKAKGSYPEYQFNVAENASEKLIRIHFDSTAPISIVKNHLKITFSDGVIYHSEPRFFEETATGLNQLKGQYVLVGKNEVGFKVFNRTHGRKLVIDPRISVTLVADYVRTANYVRVANFVRADEVLTHSPISPIKGGFDIADGSGNRVFISGVAMAPLSGKERYGRTGTDAFVLHMTTRPSPYPPPEIVPADRLSDLIWVSVPYITYLGGSKAELNAAITTESTNNNGIIDPDKNGIVYIGGRTESDDFPTPGNTFRDSPQSGGTFSTEGGAFIAQLSNRGHLIRATMLGNGRKHYINDIKFSDNSLYVAGNVRGRISSVASTRTDATDNALQAYPHDNGINTADGFLAKLDHNLASLEYFTYLGSVNFDSIMGLDVVDGKAFIAGTTASTATGETSALVQTLITPNSAQANPSYTDNGLQCRDIFDRNNLPALECLNGFISVVEINETNSSLEYGTYYGQNGVDFIRDINVEQGYVYITGGTQSQSDSTDIEQQLFVAKLDPIPNRPYVLNRLFASNVGDFGNAIDTDPLGNIHVTGIIRRDGLAVGEDEFGVFAHTAVKGAADMFYMNIPIQEDENMQQVYGETNYFAYLGGEGVDIGHGITLQQDPETDEYCAVVVGRFDVYGIEQPDFVYPGFQNDDLGVYRFCPEVYEGDEGCDEDSECGCNFNIFSAVGSTFIKEALTPETADSSSTDSVNNASAITGRSFDYVLRVRNTSTCTVDATIYDNVPMELDILEIEEPINESGEPKCINNNNNVTCSNITFDPGDTKIKIKTRLHPLSSSEPNADNGFFSNQTCPRVLFNQASITGGGFFSNTDNIMVGINGCPVLIQPGQTCYEQMCTEGYVCGHLPETSIPCEKRHPDCFIPNPFELEEGGCWIPHPFAGQCADPSDSDGYLMTVDACVLPSDDLILLPYE